MAVNLADFTTLSPQELASKYSLEELESVINTPAPEVPAADDSGISRFDPNEDFFSSKNLGSLASNILPSAGNVAKDTFNAAMSPIETGKALFEAGPSGIAKALGDRFGSIEALKRTAVEDPSGLALDVCKQKMGLSAILTLK